MCRSGKVTPASVLLLSVQYVCRSGKGSTETSVCTFVICPIRVQVGERFYRNQRLYTFCDLSNTCAGRGKLHQRLYFCYLSNTCAGSTIKCSELYKPGLGWCLPPQGFLRLGLTVPVTTLMFVVPFDCLEDMDKDILGKQAGAAGPVLLTCSSWLSKEIPGVYTKDAPATRRRRDTRTRHQTYPQ